MTTVITRVNHGYDSQTLGSLPFGSFFLYEHELYIKFNQPDTEQIDIFDVFRRRINTVHSSLNVVFVPEVEIQIYMAKRS